MGNVRVQLIEILEFAMNKNIVPIQMVAFSFATISLVRTSASAEFFVPTDADILNFLCNFCPAVCLFVFILKIFTVLVVKTLVQHTELLP